jgi:nudix-type nucleoside diphosphatase (YffH/AdpP family)
MVDRHQPQPGDRRVEVDSTRRIFDDFFKIDEALLRYQRVNGEMSDTQRLLSFERSDAAAVVLLNRSTERLIFVRQFRYPAYANGDGWMTELVAGTVFPGEDPTATMRREVEEETGYVDVDLAPIAVFYVSPGGSSERVFLFYGEVEGVPRHHGGGLDEEGEDIEIVELPIAEVAAALDAGIVIDAKTLIGLMWLRMGGRQHLSLAPKEPAG